MVMNPGYNYKKYLKELDSTNISFYRKYISDIVNYMSREASFLDIGCGNGAVLIELQNKTSAQVSGCDVCETFVAECRKKGLKVLLYDGKRLPYEDETFDVVGSFTVFEHVNDPESFLNEKLRVLKRGGHLILGCPNFATVLYNNPHRATSGLRNRIKNFFLVLRLILGRNSNFIKMEPIIREEFSPDDDAVVLANLVQLERFFAGKNMKIIKSCGFSSKSGKLLDLIGSFFLLRYFLPSCYLVIQKTGKNKKK